MASYKNFDCSLRGYRVAVIRIFTSAKAAVIIASPVLVTVKTNIESNIGTNTWSLASVQEVLLSSEDADHTPDQLPVAPRVLQNTDISYLSHHQHHQMGTMELQLSGHPTHVSAYHQQVYYFTNSLE
ncbi:hypothetical protein SK128_000099 [Halocaridina rubra]|uniref:Uncharacterized protein n=1 Tax=Halocaridina rubra TaxID=373956 RepID=A0AAN8ZZ36_HALRR